MSVSGARSADSQIRLDGFKGLLDEVDGHRCISFDIFDTLVLRNVPKPEDVFRIVFDRMRDLLTGISRREFVMARIEAERRARARYLPREVTLEEIYSEFDVVRGFADQVMKAEISAELDVCVPNLPMRAVYEGCLRQGKTVVLVSDMYLPRDAVERILEECGIVGYRHLFLSSEWGLTKREGALFDEVVRAFNLHGNDILHIGDSPESDWHAPRACNLDAFLVRREGVRSRYLKPLHGCSSFDARALACAIGNTCPEGQSAYYRFGYMCFGPLLLGFCSWLESQLSRAGIERVFFLSRDGYVMKQAFDRFGHVGVSSEYLEVSRRSLRVPILWCDDSFSTFLDMINPSKLIKIQSVFDGMGLRAEDYAKLLVDLGMSRSTVFYRGEKGSLELAQRLYERLLPDALRQSREEFDSLCAYLEQQSVRDRFAIVDIGWSGGMQRYLSTALDAIGIEHEISGYYMGVVDYARRNTAARELDLNGYLFNCLRGDEDARRFFVGLMESLFLEQRGSVSHYEVDDSGKASAIRCPYEYMEGEPPANEALCVEDIQRGALDLVDTVCASHWLRSLRLSPEEAFCGVRKVGIEPTSEDISMFGWFRFFDEGSSSTLVNPKPLPSYCRDFSKLKRDFLASRWKIGFAKKLLFGLPLPYVDIFNKLLTRESVDDTQKSRNSPETMNPEAIDILLATYNGAEYLADQLESIFAQTYSNWRVLVSDDGSTDETIQILKEYEARDRRIVVLRSNHIRQGAKDNFLYLLANSSANYAMFCDQDDIWEPDKVERALRLMLEHEAGEKNRASVLFSDLYVVDKDANVIHPSFEKYLHNNPHRLNLCQILVQNPACGCAMIINREAVRLLSVAYEGDSRLIQHHDWLAMLAVSAFGNVFYDDVQSMHYRQHGENTVGARGFGIVDRLRNRSSSEDNFFATIEQASNFVLLYRDMLTDVQKRQISDYLNLLDVDSALRGWALLVRSGCLKSGIRKIAQFVMVFRVARVNRRQIRMES